MVHLDLENKNTETMFGLFQKLNIDLDMQKKKFHKVQVFHFILNELTEDFPRPSLLRKLLKILSQLHRIFLGSLKILGKENLLSVKNMHLELPDEIPTNGMQLSAWLVWKETLILTRILVNALKKDAETKWDMMEIETEFLVYQPYD